MTSITDDLAAIKAALEAGPTFAEWEVLDDSRHIYSKTLVDDGEGSWLPLIAVTDDDETLIDFEANARYIAACNPVAIRALLDRLMAAEEEKERLRNASLSALNALEQLQGGCTDSDDGTVEAITVWCPEVLDELRAALENTNG